MSLLSRLLRRRGRPDESREAPPAADAHGPPLPEVEPPATRIDAARERLREAIPPRREEE